MNGLTFRIIDTETTGKDAKEHAVLELASLDLSDGCLGEGRSSLVNPMRDIPADSSAVHGLVDADIADAPLLEEVAPSILHDGQADYFVAHNSPFEEAFLDPYLNAPVICTMKCAMRVWPEARFFNLGYLQHWLFLGDLGMRAKPRHRSPADCFVTAHVLGRLLQEAAAEDLLAWSREHPAYPRVPFGMHEGKNWSDVPASYFDWMLNKADDLAEDLKWNARRELSRRAQSAAAIYIAKAKLEISKKLSVSDLYAWWDDGLRDRYALGMTMKGEPNFDALVKACADRRAEIEDAEKASKESEGVA